MHSMTGFGRAEGIIDNGQYTIETKSLNHRYLDIRFRAPSFLNALEIPLSECLRSHFERGSFEINIRHRPVGSGGTMVSGTRFAVDESALDSFVQGCRVIEKKLNITTRPSLEAILLSQKILLPTEETVEPDKLQGPIKLIFESALKQLKHMREVEGNHLKIVLDQGISKLTETLSKIEDRARAQRAAIEERLGNRIREWKLESPVDANRLEWEVAFHADRSDITEEMDRLKTHAGEFRRLLSDKPATQNDRGSKGIGRKLDFMTQELHREVNTLASKAILVDISLLAVEAKTLVEKLREQVQNVE